MAINENNLVVFLKYPEQGKVKTRLAKDIGDKKALLIYKNLVPRVLKQINANNYDISVCYYPENKVIKIQKWINSERYKYSPQTGGDLGIKMLNAFNDSFSSGYKRSVIIGTDCPDIDDDLVNTSFNLLNSNDLVIGPATDGGYYLIGLRESLEALFTNISWGTDTVLKQTLNIVSKLNISCKLLDFKTDIDTVEDLYNYKYLLNKQS
ncbi:MAG: DUF2064 domain-containing protein [Candidatus Dadabacteria bacterium]|nr:glycosyltransferase [Candidatus Dadabacteria bacterium]NIX15130.1 DUF2064 domain-containing protein [Candidatus Dadabacteria bacterium]NIY21767.1 DUF2064 domain-containing protein [Candidatus Dadabacteria bacterium]